MRLRFVLTIFLASFLTVATAQSTQDSKSATTPEKRLSSLVNTWFAAEKENDLSALDKLIAEDFVGTTFGGSLIAKSDLVTDTRGSNQWAGGSLQDLEVHSFGDTAAVIGRIVFKDTTLRFTEVWTKRPQGWQMVVAHLSKA